MKYRVQFAAVIDREVDVPNDFDWTEAYDYVRDQLTWGELAHSAAATITIDTSRTTIFEKVS